MEKRSYLGSITKYKELGFGSHATVYLADYFDGYGVAYKEFWNSKYVNAIKDEVKKFSEFSYDEDFIFPDVFIYQSRTDDIFKGYTMPLLYNYNFIYEKYLDSLDYDKKISILFKARELIETLHKKYKIIHADVAPWNFMYNESNDHLVLTDYDTSLSISDGVSINDSHNDIVKEYVKYNKIDECLDIFLFNLSCYAVLNNLDMNYVLDNIRNNNFGVIESKRVIDIFRGSKDLSDVKTLKKEYIIDYL